MIVRTAVLSAALIVCLSAPARAQACTTEGVNVTPSGAFSTDNRYPTEEWLSPDGRWIAWLDLAGDLVPGTVAGVNRPYIRDRVTGVTEHLAVLSNGSIPNDRTYSFDLSPDRRWLAFASGATNVVPGDATVTIDIFVLDRTTGLVERANIDSAGQPRPHAQNPAISADGRFVVFATEAVMEPADQNTEMDVYLRDRLLGTTRLVSISAGGVQGPYWSDKGQVSDDGRYVAWLSPSPNWFPGDAGASNDIFRKDMLLGTLELVSQNAAGQVSFWPFDLDWMSSDGQRFGFTTEADGMVADEPVDCCRTVDAFLRDMVTGQNTLVSRAADGTIGNSGSSLVGVSDDLRHVAFSTSATNIIPPNSGIGWQVVRKDLVTGRIEVMSQTYTSQAPNALVSGAELSGDGSVVLFYSTGTNIVPQGGGSTGPGSNLFVRDCPPPVGTPFCFGDGSGTACPCGNSGAMGHGCASATRPEGARIVVLGTASVANDTLILAGDSTSNSIVTYIQGTAAAGGGAGVVFGDGLRCVDGTVIRLGTRPTANGTSRYPGLGDPSVSQRGQVPAGGAVRHYQIWYRIAAPFCTPDTFSFSNAVTVVWAP